MFNLSKKVLPGAEIKVLEKGLDYDLIQYKVNEPELCSDFEECCRRMSLKWYFRNDPTLNFNKKPSFTPKLSWAPPKGYPILEVSLSEFEKEIFQLVDFKYKKVSNLGKLYLLPKIHKRLHLHGRPVIPNCGIPTEKAQKKLF